MGLVLLVTFTKNTLGIIKPESVDSISKAALTSGVVVPIPTCAMVKFITNKVEQTNNVRIGFISI